MGMSGPRFMDFDFSNQSKPVKLIEVLIIFLHFPILYNIFPPKLYVGILVLTKRKSLSLNKRKQLYYNIKSKQNVYEQNGINISI